MERTVVKKTEKMRVEFPYKIWGVLKAGLFGFSIFFTVLIFTKYLGFLIGTQPTFEMSMEDVYFSSIGFLLMALIKFLEEIKEKLPS